MAYIGPLPAETFTSFATQEFSTSATTSYTLDHAVTNENEIALFINNVRQQPGSGKAYTATGTALTLSAATASTDTMYAVFLGRALQTVNPADASVGTSQLTSTSVTGAKLNTDVISAQTALAAEPADTDEFLVSDAGTIKRIDYSLIKASDPTHVKIATSTISSAVSTVDLTGMDSTYQNYMVEIDNVTVASDNKQFQIRFIQGGSTISSGGGYQGQVVRFGTAEGAVNTHESSSAEELNVAHGVAGDNDQQLNGRMFIYNAPTTDAHTSFNAMISLQHRDNHDHQMHMSHGDIGNNTASTGITFRMSSGNLTAGTFRLYGIS